MKPIDDWMVSVLEIIPPYKMLHYGNTRQHAIANFYRIQLDLPKLESHEEAVLFIDELFRIHFEELVTIGTLLGEKS